MRHHCWVNARLCTEIDKICKMLDIHINIKLDPDLVRPNDNKIIIGSHNKITTAHGWKPRYELEESLYDMIRYWESQEY